MPATAATAETAILAGWGERFAPEGWLAIPEGGDVVLVTATSQSALRAAEAAYGSLPHTVESISTRGGLHRWFRGAGLTRTTVSPGVEVRAGPSAVLPIPPLRHADGGRYVWLTSPTETGDFPRSAPALLSANGRRVPRTRVYGYRTVQIC